MEQFQTESGSRIRRDYMLLVFLSTSAVPIVLWFFFLGLALISGAPLLTGPGGVGFALTMFLFPFVFVFFLCGIAILITAAVQRGSGIAILIFLLLGVLIPLIAIAWVGLGVYTARRLYILSLADARHAKSIFPQFYGPLFDDPEAVSKISPASVVKPATPADHAEALKRLKEMMDLGLITAADFEAKKAEILSRM